MAKVKRPDVCADLVKELNKTWNHTFTQNELVLIFKCDVRQRDVYYLPCILEADPSKVKSSTEQQQQFGRFSDPDPVTYIDCSEIRFCDKSKTKQLNAEEFASLLILSKYLSQVKYVKILVVIKKDFLFGDTKDSRDSLLSCPALSFLSEYPHIRSSVGLVLVTQKVKGDPSESTGSIPGRMREVKSALRQEVLDLREKVKDECFEASLNTPELQQYLDILSTLSDINNVLVLQQDRFWNGDIKRLVHLPSPPGFKILRFCQTSHWFYVTDRMTRMSLWPIFKSSGASLYFSEITRQLFRFFEIKITESVQQALNRILDHYQQETVASPQRKDKHVWLGERLIDLVNFCKSDENNGFEPCQLLEHIESKMKFPKNVGCYQKIKQFNSILDLVQAQAKILELPFPNKIKLTSALSQCQERIKSKIMPLVIPELQKHRNELCSKLQNYYIIIVDILGAHLNSQEYSNHLVERQTRENAIDKLHKGIEILEKLQWNTGTCSQISVYLEFARIVEIVLPNSEEEEAMELLHKKIDAIFCFTDTEYISCNNHNAQNISENLLKQTNDIHGSVIRCHEIVDQLEEELEAFKEKVLFQFEQNQLLHNLTRLTVTEKLKNLLEPSIVNLGNLDYGKISHSMNNIVDQLDYHQTVDYSNYVITVQELQNGLKLFLEDIQEPGLEPAILKQCGSIMFSVNERMIEWKNRFDTLELAMERIKNYHYQKIIRRIASEKVVTNPTICQILDKLFPENPQSSDIFYDVTEPIKKLFKEIITYGFSLNVETTLDKNSKPHVSVFGNFVKLSDLADLRELNNPNRTEIRILASEKIFIDCDFCKQVENDLVVTMMAPCVEVIGNKVLDFGGKAGRSHSQFYSRPAMSGQSGLNGIPGNPGFNGGNFFLICDAIQNGDNLQIKCVGGKGGDGRDGRDGSDGADGENAGPHFLSGNQTECYGIPGEKGGNGGHGGAGGLGGLGGTVKIDILGGGDKCVKICCQDGTIGKGGKGGNGGRGGRGGLGYKLEKVALFFTKGVVVYNRTFGVNGTNGMDGVNITGRVPPKPKWKDTGNAQSISAEYRRFLLNLDNCGSAATELLEKYENKLELEHLTPITFAKELRNIELKFLGDNSNPERIIKEHQSFQERLQRYQNFLEQTGSGYAQKKMVLDLLQAFSLSRVLTLKESSSNLGAQVINLQGYFEVIAETIKGLNSNQLELYRQKNLEEYNSHISSKCSNIQSHITKIVTPAIHQAQREMQRGVENCLKEINKYRELLLQEKRQKGVDAEVIQTIKNYQTATNICTNVEYFSDIALKVISVLRFLNPAAADTAMAVSGWTRVIASGVKHKIKDYTPNYPAPREGVHLPDCLNSDQASGDPLEAMKTQIAIQRQLEWISEFVDKYIELKTDVDPLFNKLFETFVKFKKTLEAESFSQTRDLADLQVEMNLLLEQIVKIVQEAEGNDPTFNGAKRHLLAKLAIINSNPDDIFPKNGNNCGTFKNYWNGEDGQLEIVKKRQESLQEKLVPLMNLIVEQANTRDKSTHCKVHKWQMQQMLRDLKQNVSSFVKGLNSSKSLTSAIKKVEEAISLMIDLNEELEGYEDSKLLGEKMSAMSAQSMDFSNTIEDPELRGTLKTLQFQLKANIFLLDYKQALKAFKQWVFPFAAKYFPEGLDPPVEQIARGFSKAEEDQRGDQVQQLVQLYMEKFSQLHIHLAKYQAMSLDFDAVVFTGEFSRATKTNPPFFAWKGKTWEPEIGRILKGEEVELPADVWKAKDFDKGRRGAVKFKSVHLTFKHQFGKNCKEQKDLEKVLNEQFRVTLVHSGISYYRMFDQCFVMRGNQQEFSYSFDKSTQNMVYEKTSGVGDYLLSPYTTWGIKLTNMGNKDGGFEVLKKFWGKVRSVELEGQGWYVDEKVAREKGLETGYLKNLQDYYELEETVVTVSNNMQ